MLDKINNYLLQYENISFALIFGSFVSNNNHNLSDLDIGIYTKSEFDLLSIGKIIYDLEKITKLKIDLVELNNLPKKFPYFAFNIVNQHKVIFIKDEEEFIKFKREALLYYFDIQPLREKMNNALLSRIENLKFGKLYND
ncbi:MAG: nucleotidyltransferase domain-containing protein [Ignavibacterium sp.]|nr:nucleotidyltransferase domain-containing protein [Ignavibacterium sp.]MDW8374848.1 nucleotidyltransferase domain-containing protein [Ignavibacteriales bacterium]